MAQPRQTVRHHRQGGDGPPAGGAAAGGTLGGVRSAIGARPGARSVSIGDEGYLWILVALEIAAIGWLRQAFRRHHGG